MLKAPFVHLKKAWTLISGIIVKCTKMTGIPQLHTWRFWMCMTNYSTQFPPSHTPPSVTLLSRVSHISRLRCQWDSFSSCSWIRIAHEQSKGDARADQKEWLLNFYVKMYHWPISWRSSIPRNLMFRSRVRNILMKLYGSLIGCREHGLAHHVHNHLCLHIPQDQQCCRWWFEIPDMKLCSFQPHVADIFPTYLGHIRGKNIWNWQI